MVEEDVDVLIIGGGLIGASMMLALEQSGLRVVLVDAEALSDRLQPDFDARSLALSPASVRILESLGVWSLMLPEACPIKTIHVSERGAFGSTTLRAEADSALGYVVEMQSIQHAFYQRLNRHSIYAPAKLLTLDATHQVATVRSVSGEHRFHAKLIIAADGTHSAVRTACGVGVRTKAYHQHAIVTNIGLAREHQHMAYERFTPQGPLALLPMTGLRVSVVWALVPEEAARVVALHDRDFLDALQRAFGYRLGRFVRVGKRVTYPLQQVITQPSVLGSVVFIGNAAQTLHPVAGQGFNLGLRDVAMLAQCLIQEGISTASLRHYQSLRAADQRHMIQFTDRLIDIFTSDFRAMACARRAGLLVLENLPVAKRVLSHFARGYFGHTPDLACGISLGETLHEV